MRLKEISMPMLPSRKMFRSVEGGANGMKKIIMLVSSIAAIAGIAITAVCMPDDRF